MNLGLCLPAPADPTSFYRALGVFGPLAKEHNINLITGNYWSWENVIQCDVLFVQRPFADEHRKVCEIARSLKVPIWLDYDDNLWNVPQSNSAYQLYMNTRAHANMRTMCRMADVVTVTTQELARQIQGATVVPNAFNDYIWDMSELPRQNSISWRGSATHFEDMEGYIPQIEYLARINSEWNWHFIGQPHWAITKGIIPPKRIALHQYCDSMFSYIETFRQVAPSIHIVTLQDSLFNKCKSNLAWVESTMCGAVTIAPDWEEWGGRGCILYDSPDTFYDAVHQAIVRGSDWRRTQLTVARDYINFNLKLSHVNESRWEILKRLAKKDT